MSSEQIAFIIFILTYIGVALGEIPGLAIDRTGIALLGATTMVVSGVVTMPDAVASIDVSTILLLYSLMVVSSQFRVGGFYTHIALAITKYMGRPATFLLATMTVSAPLSAVLANDIVCLAFTPVLVVSLARGGLNPVPFLLGLAAASNIGSAATIIGNPQNMLIGQLGHLHFGRFFAWCLVPSVISFFGAYFILFFAYRGRFAAKPVPREALEAWPAYNRHQSLKGILITVVLMVLFFTPIPRELSALCAAGFLLCSRKLSTRALLGFVDWHLITLFCGLFIVIHGIEIAHVPEQLVQVLGGWGIHVQNLYWLTAISVALSNLVSNVPATMLLAKFIDADYPTAWYVLALSSTFAGNLITIGSIANLITIEQAKLYGVTIRFRDHAKTGVWITLFSILVTIVWIASIT